MSAKRQKQANQADRGGRPLRQREPWLHIAKRPEMSKKRGSLLKGASILLAVAVGGLFMLALGYNPVTLYLTIITGALGNAESWRMTIRLMIPLVISSLAVCLAFKMRFWNIGAEGQIIMGAVFATYFALYHTDWPRPLLLAVMFIAGAVGGALWGLLPAFFKARFNTNETLFTLMLNYIALNVIVYFRDGPWKDPGSSGFPKIARFDKVVQLPKLAGIQAGWLIALILVVLVFVYLKYSKHGYEIKVVGASQATARYAGMNVRRIILRTMAISGALAGIAGMVQAAGSDMTLAESVAGGVGFTAIIVAWLSNLNPFGIALAAFFFSVLEKGSSVMRSSYNLSAEFAAVLQGIILFCVLGGEFFLRYRLVRRSAPRHQEAEAAEAKEEA